MHRSHAKKRLDKNDADTEDVRKRMLAMEQWRDNFLKDNAKYHSDIQKQFGGVEQRHDRFLDVFREYCDETGSKLRASDRRHEAHLGRFDDIDSLLEQIDKDISEVKIVMSEN